MPANIGNEPKKMSPALLMRLAGIRPDEKKSYARSYPTTRSESTYMYGSASDAETEDSEATDVYDDDEALGISGTVPLKPRDVQANRDDTSSHRTTGPEYKAWTEPKTVGSDSVTGTDLLTIRGLEYLDEKGTHGKITIAAPGGPTTPDLTGPDSLAPRWLHITRPSISLSVLEQYVKACPYISQDMRDVAKTVLEEVGKRLVASIDRGSYIEAGAVLRYVGTYPPTKKKKRRETEPVTFSSCPYFTFQARRNTTRGVSQFPQTLLHHLYGYDFEADSAISQVVQKLGVEESKETLHVAQMWCLLIGSDCMITFSPASLNLIKGELMTVDPLLTSKPRLLSAVLVYKHSDYERRYELSVAKDWNYVDFMQHAMKTLKKDPWRAGEFYVVRKGHRLSSEKWLRLMARRRSTKLGTFHIRKGGSHSGTYDISEVYSSSSSSISYHDSQTSSSSEDSVSDVDPGPSAAGPSETKETETTANVESKCNVAPETVIENWLAWNSSKHLNDISKHPWFTSLRASPPIGTMCLNSQQSDPKPGGPEIFAQQSRDKQVEDSQSTSSCDGTDDSESWSGPQPRHRNSRNPSGTGLIPVSFPFFQWRTDKDMTNRTAQEMDASLLENLSSVDKVIYASWDRNMYRSAFGCTLEMLLLRNSFSPQTEVMRTSHSPTDKSARPEAKEQPDTATHDTQAGKSSDNKNTPEGPDQIPKDPTGTKSVSFEEPEAHSTVMEQSVSGRKESKTSTVESEKSVKQTMPDVSDEPDFDRDYEGMPVEASQHDTLLMKNLFEVSRSILSAFVPQEGGHDHCLVTRFWGSLDRIFRQIKWASAHEGRHRTQTYRIRNFDHLREPGEVPNEAWRPSLSWSDCPECSANQEYTSVARALGHLHLSHFVCLYDKTNERPFNDPCYVWLIQKASGDPKHKEVSGLAQDFIRELWGFDRQIKELHFLVARPSTPAEAANIMPPILPDNLKRAFGAVVVLYVVHARQLSLINLSHFLRPITRRQMLEKDRIQRSVGLAADRHDATKKGLENFLHLAKEGILWLEHSIGDKPSIDDSANPRTKTVGLEFLALAAMSGLQNRPVLPDPATNVEDIYSMCMSNIRFRASRRPNRRLFLQLNALLDELNAVRSVVVRQGGLVANYLRLLSPDSFGASNIKRSRPFENERLFAIRQIKLLDARYAKLGSLIQMTPAFREQVKQTIEVLEEDHGKAIRVFTIVTLFFLPMSFISSFMGMNTVDIRDTSYNQGFFWMVSIPVTALVLVIALTYGYKGDEIGDWISLKLHEQRQKLHAASTNPALNTDYFGERLMAVKQVSTRNPTWEPWEEFKRPSREDGSLRMRRRKTAGVRRRSARQYIRDDYIIDD